jgi:hypothetical protein
MAGGGAGTPDAGQAVIDASAGFDARGGAGGMAGLGGGGGVPTSPPPDAAVDAAVPSGPDAARDLGGAGGRDAAPAPDLSGAAGRDAAPPLVQPDAARDLPVVPPAPDAAPVVTPDAAPVVTPDAAAPPKDTAPPPKDTASDRTPDTAPPASAWKKANLTHYTSYPDPGSEECIVYNGCMWAGMFAFVSGKQPESWVMANNIAAIHSKDAPTYKLKTLRVKQGTHMIDAKVYDQCSDSDCSGCCTDNSRQTGFLIDLEKYTMQRFGGSDGVVDWMCLDCP